MQPYAADEISQIYDKLISELEILLHGVIAPGNPHLTALHNLLEAVLVARSTREVTSAVALLQKVHFALIHAVLFESVLTTLYF